MKRFFLFTFSFLLILFFYSCEKVVKEVEDAKNTVYSAEDNTVIENEVTDEYDFVDDFSGWGPDDKRKGTWKHLVPEQYVSGKLDTSTGSLDVKLDFGSTGWVSNSGIVRKGQMNIFYDNATFKTTKGAKATVKFANFSVNRDGENHDVTGIVYVKNISQDGNKFEISVENLKHVFGGKSVLIEKSVGIITKTAGLQTVEDPSDDVYVYHGTLRGVNRDNAKYTTKIDSSKALYKEMGYGTITKGEIELQVDGDNDKMTIDFGYPNNGAKDKLALITYGQIKKEIKMK